MLRRLGIIISFVLMILASPAEAQVNIYYIDSWNYILVNNDYRAAACRVRFPDGFYIDFWIPPGQKTQSFPNISNYHCSY